MRRALGAFRKLAMVAAVFILVSGGVMAIQFMFDKRPLDFRFLIAWGFWAVCVIALVVGYGLGNEVARAFTHRQRWRHAAPWLVIVGLCVALAWSLGANVEAMAGRTEFPVSPVVLLFGVFAGMVQFRSQGRARRE